MEDLDLSQIDPLRRAEVRRRVEVLDRYLRITLPTTADAAVHAGQIGISVAQFYRLAQAWRIHRDPKLVGAGQRGGRRVRRDGVPSSAKRIVSAVMDDLGAEASQQDISREVARRCQGARIPTPSRGAMWTYIMDARATAPIRDNEPNRVVVGRLWVKLPTAHGGNSVFPQIALAVLLPDRLVLGLDVSCEHRRKASASMALARAFASMPSELDDVEIVIDPGDADDVAAVHLARLGTMPRPSKTSVSRLLSANLGRRLGGLVLMHRGHSSKTSGLLQARANSAVDCGTARAEIERAARAHNEILAEMRSAKI